MTLLYKYTSLEGALSILGSNSVGFSNAMDLNDPFELKGTQFPLDAGCAQRNDEMYFYLAKCFGILSLTRTHLNPIMWSLYAEQHKGVVIAFDPEKSGFNRDAVIPANKGNVIYSRTHPGDLLEHYYTTRSEMKKIFSARTHDELNEREKDVMSMYFLNKSYWWGHEEEVRVVKNVTPSYRLQSNTHTEQWSELKIEGRSLYCLNLPDDSIRHIYLGARFWSINSEIRNYHLGLLHHLISFGIPVSTVKLKDKSWELEDDRLYGIDEGYAPISR
jgi:hypothetical protein